MINPWVRFQKKVKLESEFKRQDDAHNLKENANTVPPDVQRWKVKVLIEDRTLLIPIPSPESNMKWLSSQVAKRFADRCGKEIYSVSLCGKPANAIRLTN